MSPENRAKPVDVLKYLREKIEKDPEAKRYYEEYFRRFDLAANIQEMREAAGLTQEQLANKIGVQCSEIVGIEDPDCDDYSAGSLKKVGCFFKISLWINHGSNI